MPDDFAECASSMSRWTEPWAGVPYKLPFGPGNEDDSLEDDGGAIDAELLDATSARRSSSFPPGRRGIATCLSGPAPGADTADELNVNGVEESWTEDGDAIAPVGTSRIRLITCMTVCTVGLKYNLIK